MPVANASQGSLALYKAQPMAAMRLLQVFLGLLSWELAGAFVPISLPALSSSRRAACLPTISRRGMCKDGTIVMQTPMEQGGGASKNKGARLVRFKAADMEILRPIGEMGFATVTDWEYFGEAPRNPLDPNTPTRTVETEGATIRLFEARVARGSLMGARMLLKEYFPSAKELATQELRVYTDLIEDWNVRMEGQDFGDAPVATLRGWFETSFEVRQPAFVNNWRERFPRSNPPDPGNIWLVFRLDSGSALPKLYNDRSKPASFWDKLSAPAIGGSAAGAAEARFIRQVMKNSIAALAFLHDRQVLHRSVSAPSIVLSSINAEDSSSLRVKMQDLGFASRASQLDEASLFKARQAGASTPSEMFAYLAAEDVYAMGYTLMETVFTVLARKAPSAGGGDAGNGPQGLMKAWLKQTDKEPVPGPVAVPDVGGGGALATDQGALKRLVEDVFEFDVVGGFRDYCEGTQEWSDVVAFLDERDGAGWQLFQSMLNEPRRTQRKRESSASRGGGQASGQNAGGSKKELSEMSEEELGEIEIPSFIPKEMRTSTVSSARGLLGSPLFNDLSMPWWLPMQR